MKRISIILAILLIGGGLALPVSAFDKKLPDEPLVDVNDFRAWDSFVRVYAIGTAQGIYPDLRTGKWMTRWVPFRLAGSGTVVTEGYVLTCAHVVFPDTVSTPASSSATYVAKPVKIIDRTIWLRGTTGVVYARVVHIDHEHDVAVLRYRPMGGVLYPLNIPIVQVYESIQPGDVLALVTHERNDNGSLSARIRIIEGTIMATSPEPPHHNQKPWFSLWDMTMNAPIIPGDSGSAVFAFLDGEPRLIGIARAIYNDGIVHLTFFACAVKFKRYLDVY